MLIIYKTAKYPTRLAPVGYKIKSLFLFSVSYFFNNPMYIATNKIT